MSENVNNPFSNDVTNPFEAEELLNSAAFESFLEEVAQCVHKLDEYNTNLEQIKDLQSKIFKMPQQDRRKSMANEIDELNQNNKNLRNEIRLVIKSGRQKRFNNGDEEKIRIDKLKSLTEKLQEYIQESIKTDTEYSNKSKKMLKGSLQIAGIKKSEEEIEAMIESDSLENIVTGMLSQASEATRKDLENANERQKELKKCEDAIKEMLDLFKELQQYVEDQGFVLDEIEQKTERTETTIKVAVSAIKDARDIKDMVRRNKKILWMILAAVLLTFLIIVIASITSQQPVEDSIVLVIDNKPVTVVQTCDPMKDYDCVG